MSIKNLNLHKISQTQKNLSKEMKHIGKFRLQILKQMFKKSQ